MPSGWVQAPGLDSGSRKRPGSCGGCGGVKPKPWEHFAVYRGFYDPAIYIYI